MLLFERLPDFGLAGVEKVEDIGRDEAERPIIIVAGAFVIAARRAFAIRWGAFAYHACLAGQGIWPAGEQRALNALLKILFRKVDQATLLYLKRNPGASLIRPQATHE